MKINEKMNLVIPLYDDDGRIYSYVHSAPISREVFEANFLLVSKTFSAIYAEGLNEISGPRVAALVMRRIAKQIGDVDGAVSFMNEVRRLSNVSIKTDAGWEQIPLQDAIDGEKLTPDDIAEVENSVTFFIAVSAMHRKQVAAEILPGAAKLWGAQITSSNASDFHASLKTSAVTVNTGASPKPASSVVF